MRLPVILACVGFVSCANEQPAPQRSAAPQLPASTQSPRAEPDPEPPDPHDYSTEPPVGFSPIPAPSGLIGGVDSTISVTGGTLPQAMLTALVQRHNREIVRCYDIGRREERYLSGNATFAFTVINGTVSDVHRVSDALASRVTKSCISSAIGRWTFPPSAAPITIEVHYVFTPPPDEGEADILS